MRQTEIENHNPPRLPQDIHEVSVPSDAPRSDALPSLRVRSYTPAGMQLVGDSESESADALSSPSRQMENIALSPTVTLGQSTSMLRTSRQRQQKQAKKKRDMVRKRVQRSDDSQDLARICELLKIPLSPKKTLARRSEYLFIHLYIFVRGIECIIVLVSVEALVERCRFESASEHQCQLEEREASAVVVREELARLSTQGNTASSPPINAYNFLGGSDVYDLGAMGRGLDEWHNRGLLSSFVGQV
jgi:hypothetical protein